MCVVRFASLLARLAISRTLVASIARFFLRLHSVLVLFNWSMFQSPAISRKYISSGVDVSFIIIYCAPSPTREALNFNLIRCVLFETQLNYFFSRRRNSFPRETWPIPPHRLDAVLCIFKRVIQMSLDGVHYEFCFSILHRRRFLLKTENHE